MSIERLVSGDLTIDPQPSPEDGTIVLEWRGRSTDRQPARAIVPYVTPCLERALHLKVPVRMHFERLEHMNSSTITAIIQIIQEARARGTRLVLVYSADKRWQKLGFEALRVFVKDDGLLELSTQEAS
ncbi:MAG TPA: hypothetical protein VM925_37045 [Labilithrix sp.]|nr:hypothetical protein [Labilithrix sp.]